MKQAELTPAEKAGLVVGGIYWYIGKPSTNVEPQLILFYSDDKSPNPDFLFMQDVSGRHLSEALSQDQRDKILEIKEDVCCSFRNTECVINYFTNPFNPTENEAILLSLETGTECGVLSEQIETAKKISKIIRGIDSGI